MRLPQILDIGIGSAIYLIIAYIIVLGVLKFAGRIQSRKSMIPLGVIGLIFGCIGYLQAFRKSMDVVREELDISASLMAKSISDAVGYPIVGLLCLAIAYFEKYINQEDVSKKN